VSFWGTRGIAVAPVTHYPLTPTAAPPIAYLGGPLPALA
jgi:hypothetical protein